MGNEAHKLAPGFRQRFFVVELRPQEKIVQTKEERSKENDTHRSNSSRDWVVCFINGKKTVVGIHC